MLEAKLRVVGGKHDGKIIPLKTRKFLMGREQDCQLRPNSELVSRHHCVFTIDDFTVRLRDLGSTNGTFVNNERLRGERVLQVGDRVRVGRLDFDIVIGRSDSAHKSNDGAEQDSVNEALNTETTELSASETSFELPAQSPELLADDTPADADTTVIPPSQPQPANPQAGSQHPQGQPVPAQPYSPQPMPYPQMPYPQMPYGYPHQPGMGMSGVYPGYPHQHPGQYPQPGYYPQQPFYGPAPTPSAPAQTEETSQPAGSVPPLRLPVPTPKEARKDQATAQQPNSQDGADSGEQPAKAEQKPADQANPSQRAADIIRSYTHRRPDAS